MPFCENIEIGRLSIRLLAARQELKHCRDMGVNTDLSSNMEKGRCVLRFSGSLTLLRIRRLSEQVGEIEAEGLVVDLSEVEKMDTAGAWLVHKLERDRGHPRRRERGAAIADRPCRPRRPAGEDQARL